MSEISLLRTNSDHVDFRELVAMLDRELSVRDGDDHAFYDQFNKLDAIKHVVVAYEDDIAVSCGAFKPFDDTTVEIKRMYTRLESRGRGIAARILIELELWAIESGFTAAVLETGIKQPEAIRLYEKSGYIRIPNYGQYAGVEQSYCFRKKLNRLFFMSP